MSKIMNDDILKALLEYGENEKALLNSLGRKSGSCNGMLCSKCPFHSTGLATDVCTRSLNTKDAITRKFNLVNQFLKDSSNKN